MRYITPLKRVAMAMLCSTAMSPALMAQQTRILTPEQYSDYGLVYSLPLTALEIDITARHTVEKAGPYFQYAKKYIGTDKVIKADSERWEVTGVEVRPYGVADSDTRYRMQLKPGSPAYICVADDGMLLAINTKKDIPQRADMPANPPAMTLPTGNEYLQYVGEDFMSSQSSAKRAQMLSESLMEVREARLSLTRGTAETMPTDGHQLELMLNSLGNQEQLMLNAFCGQTLTETRTARFTFTPDEEGAYILTRLSDYDGFVAVDDLSGSPVTITVGSIEEAEVPLDEKGNPAAMAKDAVAYKLPGRAEITISWQGTEFFSKEMEFGQYGTVFGLNPNLFTAKKNASFAIFNPVTGALSRTGTVNP